jgi:hypothetical protein
MMEINWINMEGKFILYHTVALPVCRMFQQKCINSNFGLLANHALFRRPYGQSPMKNTIQISGINNPQLKTPPFRNEQNRESPIEKPEFTFPE